MSDEPPTPAPDGKDRRKAAAEATKAEREARLAKALRENLKRRKAQARARDAKDEG